MSNKKTDENDFAIILRQKEYFQYLFEQEQKRSNSIISGAKVYIGFLVFIIGSIFLKVISVEDIDKLFNNIINPYLKIIVIFLLILSVISLLISIIFTILVLKVWSYERLCNPIERFKETILMTKEYEVISKCLSDFAITVNRNNQINNTRARYLSFALAFLLAGLLFSIITATSLNLI